MFFTAVDIWLANPRHYNVTRDIGESCLKTSDYENDLAEDVQSAKTGYTLPEMVKETKEDKEFIAEEGSVDEESEDDLDRLENGAEEANKQRTREKSQAKKKKSLSKVSRDPVQSTTLKNAFKTVKQKVTKSSCKLMKAPKRKKQVGL